MNRRQIVFPLAACAIGLGLIAVRATASGAAADVSQVRAVPVFDHVQLNGAFTTTIVAGRQRTAVRVTAPADLANRVTTDVKDGTLIVGMKSGTNFFHFGPKLAIEVPALRGFENSGTGTTTISGLNGGDLDVANSGAASITLSGRAARLTIALNGTGKIDAGAVDAKDVTVDNNGVGSIVVRASGALVMNVNGVGSIRYAGKPAHVESHINGVGSISPV